MSLMFKPPANDSNLDPKLVKTMLDENALLIKIVTEYQNKGKVYECMKYHDILARNLLYLSGKSDFQADENFLNNQKQFDQSIAFGRVRAPDGPEPGSEVFTTR